MASDEGEVPVLAPEGSADAPLALEPVLVAPARPPGAVMALSATVPRQTLADSARELSAAERAMVGYIDEHDREAVEFLERIVNVNSGTMNHEGVREVGRIFEEELRALGFEPRWIPMPAEVNRAGHLFVERDGGSGKRVLLIGHLDTVYEKDSPFQRFDLLEGGYASGPGVADMKGGNVVILYALKAMQAAGALADARIIVALLGDEEATGDPLTTSRADLIEAASRSDAALGFEGGVGGMNSATIARRGFTGWALQVTARRGHSSLIFKEEYGAGAIFEAARILSAFYVEMRGEPYLTLGPGIIVGGTTADYDAEIDRGTAFGKTNVIPQTVTAAGDLRTLSSEQLKRAKARMERIVVQSLPQASATITFRDSYPPMAPTAGNEALLVELDAVSRDLGFGPIEPVDPGRRGAADVSFAAQHTAALGGLGVVGKDAHSLGETVNLESIPVMSKRTAVLVHRLTRTAPEGKDP
jgi:glutamate carboxypeptidase